MADETKKKPAAKKEKAEGAEKPAKGEGKEAKGPKAAKKGAPAGEGATPAAAAVAEAPKGAEGAAAPAPVRLVAWRLAVLLALGVVAYLAGVRLIRRIIMGLLIDGTVGLS